MPSRSQAAPHSKPAPMRRRRVILAAAIAAALAAAGPLVPVQANAQAPVQGGSFAVPVISNPALWPLIGGIQNVMVNRVLFSSLTTYQEPGLEVIGDLAESWSVSQDGLTWTFKLRSNAKWHDGKPFTADDVVFTIGKVWLNPQISFPSRSNFTTLTGVEKIDDHTIRLITRVPTPSLPVMLGYIAPILPAHIFQSWAPADYTKPEAFTRRPIGTGPFKFAEFVPGAQLRLERFNEYFGGQPHLDAVVFRIMPDIEQQFAQLQSGQLDWMLIEPYQLDALKGNTRVRLNEVKSNMYMFAHFNHTIAPFDDRLVRQALNHATDKQSIIDSTMAGKADIANSPITPVLGNFYNPAAEAYRFDPAKARALLDQAGWKPGAGGVRVKDGKPLKVVLEVDAGNTTREQTALILQENWKQVGVSVEVKSGDFGALVTRLRAKTSDVQSAVSWYITPPDPDIASYYGTGQSLNIFKYSNPEVDVLLDKGRQTLDPAARATLYKQAQRLIADDAPIVFLYYARELEGISSRVNGWPATLGYRYSLAQMHKVWKSR